MDDIRTYLRSFSVALRAAGKAPRTVQTYVYGVEQLAIFLDEHGYPTALDQIDRAAIREHLAWMADNRAPATAAQRHGSLRAFFRWAHDEGELPTNVMDGVKKPKVPDKPIPVFTDDELRALLKTCDGTSFVDRRDTAILRVFLDTGARLAEVASLTVPDLDLDRQQFVAVVKGGHVRVMPFGVKTAQALDRYERARRRHRYANADAWWLGKAGPMTPSGVGQVVRSRGRQAGIEGAHPHRFRHTFASRWLESGGNEGDLTRILGWKDRQMLARYASSTAQARAEESYRRSPLIDRL